MPLIVGPLPKAAEAVLRAEVGPAFGRQGLPIPVEVRIGFPVRVYTVPPLQLVEGRWVNDAKWVGWDVLVFDGGVPRHTAHLTARGPRPAYRFATLRVDSAADLVSRARAAERHRRVRGSDFDAYKLVVPEIGLSALWCASRTGDDNLFAVTSRATRRVRVYPSDELARTWRTAACRHYLNRASRN